MNFFTLTFFLFILSNLTWSQTKKHFDAIDLHKIKSTFLEEEREYWISLPLHYNDSLHYPVIYVLDAEWRFDKIRNMVFDMGANQKIENSIVVGIPHVEMDNKRGQDLTFSQSRIEYDGEAVDSTWYNASNSGSGMQFYQYLTKELMPHVDAHYSTNGIETLIGHSYGGYFGGYLLSLENPFERLHIYDPSMWFSNGEVIERIKNSKPNKKVKIYLTYQPKPQFHKEKIEDFIKVVQENKNIELQVKFYPNETHNTLFLDSFYKGIIITNQKRNMK